MSAGIQALLTATPPAANKCQTGQQGSSWGGWVSAEHTCALTGGRLSLSMDRHHGQCQLPTTRHWTAVMQPSRGRL